VEFDENPRKKNSNLAMQKLKKIKICVPLTSTFTFYPKRKSSTEPFLFYTYVEKEEGAWKDLLRGSRSFGSCDDVAETSMSVLLA
ncbi:14832_t:CDS:2, partial [Gigaspora rosea]